MSSPSLATAAAPPAVSFVMAAFTLALLLGLQPVTTDLYLPALPALSRELGGNMATTQLTLSVLLLSFGLAQLVWGPVSDHFGRRPVLLVGLALYTVASAACAASGSLDMLVVWRGVQGAAMAAAVVVARAVLRDLFEPAAGAQMMAWALTGLGVMALLCPLWGGLTAFWWGWRGSFLAITFCGALTLLWVALRWPETLIQRQPQATSLRPLLATSWAIARHPVFRAWGLLVACTYGGLFTILAGSSFVYMDVLGLSPAAYGAVMAVGSLSYIVGTFVCRTWIRRHGMDGAVGRGAVFTLAGGVLGGVAAWLQVETVWAVLVPHCIFALGHGLHQPCAQAGVVAPFPAAAGTASALAGLLLALVAFAIGRWLGVALDGTVQPLLWGLCFWSVATSLVAWTLVQKALR